MKERLWFNRGTNEVVFQTVAPPLHDECSLQFEKSRFGILNSASEMSQMECCHLRNLQVTWSHRFFQEPVKVAQKLENTVLLVVRWGFHSSATKNVRSSSDCDGTSE